MPIFSSWWQFHYKMWFTQFFQRTHPHAYTCARTCKHTIQLGVNAPLEHYDYFSNYCFSRDHTIRLDRALYWRLRFQTLSVTTAHFELWAHLSYYNEISTYAQNIACTYLYVYVYVVCICDGYVFVNMRFVFSNKFLHFVNFFRRCLLSVVGCI